MSLGFPLHGVTVPTHGVRRHGRGLTERDVWWQDVARQILHGVVRRCGLCGMRWEYRGYGEKRWYPVVKRGVPDWDVRCRCGRPLPDRP